MSTVYSIPKDEYRALVEERDKLFALLKHESEQVEELRELCRELYEDQCDDCDRWKYRDRMSGLGVEV